VKTRCRRFRIVTGIALFAASAAVSTAMMGFGGLLVEVRQSPALVSAGPLLCAEHTALPPLLPLASQPLPVARFAAVASAKPLPPTAAQVVASRTSLAMGSFGEVISGGALGGWLLGYAGKNSRTRGQPRVGALVS
jgi:hypothetical protein